MNYNFTTYPTFDREIKRLAKKYKSERSNITDNEIKELMRKNGLL